MSGVIEYRDDDVLDRGFCPNCGAPLSNIGVDGSGFCEIHGMVWAEWKQLGETPDEEDEEDE
jgi:uncharacterized Zn finger protein (UPF0148 family)